MPNAVFYHCRLSGGSNVDTGNSVNVDFGRRLFLEQMNAFVNSGLWENSHAVYIGLNGGHDDFKFVEDNMPVGCTLIGHGEKAESLLPTFLFMQEWVKSHPGWNVCVFHTKGATHPDHAPTQQWRKDMEQSVIWNWKQCVADLDSGFDTVGRWWIAPETHPSMFYPHHETKTPYWGGVFWWAKSDFLAKLPPLITEIKRRHDWYAPELFIGSGPKPKVKDYLQ